TAADDPYAVDEDGTLVVPAASGVLANDVDLEGDGLSAALVEGPQHGSLTLNADGSFTYTPEADFNGVDSFTYRANDGSADAVHATVNINVAPVNDAPVIHAIADKVVSEGITLSFVVTATDIDGPSDTLTYSLVAGPEGASIDPLTGEFSFTPTEQQGPGLFTATVRVTDSAGATSETSFQ